MAARQLTYFEDVAAMRRFPHLQWPDAKAGVATMERAARGGDTALRRKGVPSVAGMEFG